MRPKSNRGNLGNEEITSLRHCANMKPMLFFGASNILSLEFQISFRCTSIGWKKNSPSSSSFGMHSSPLYAISIMSFEHEYSRFVSRLFPGQTAPVTGLIAIESYLFPSHDTGIWRSRICSVLTADHFPSEASTSFHTASPFMLI